MANEIKYVIFDFETSDLYNRQLQADHIDQAWPVQVGVLYLDKNLNILKKIKEYVAPPHKDATIAIKAFETHGIKLSTCFKKGVSYKTIRSIFEPLLYGNAIPVGHNVWFDLQFLNRYVQRLKEAAYLETNKKKSICTMRKSTAFCKLPPTKNMLKYKGLRYKTPKLEELYEILFNKKLTGAHDALADVEATHMCLKELVRRGIIKL